MGHTISYHWDPTSLPYDLSPLEFDPLYGFPEGARQKKVCKASPAEVESMQPPREYRSYCLHKIFEFKACQLDNWPLVYKCNHKVHEYHACENEEVKDRFKDYEREKRLIQRRNRILKKQEEMRKQAEGETLAG